MGLTSLPSSLGLTLALRDASCMVSHSFAPTSPSTLLPATSSPAAAAAAVDLAIIEFVAEFSLSLSLAF